MGVKPCGGRNKTGTQHSRAQWNKGLELPVYWGQHSKCWLFLFPTSRPSVLYKELKTAVGAEMCGSERHWNAFVEYVQNSNTSHNPVSHIADQQTPETTSDTVMKARQLKVFSEQSMAHLRRVVQHVFILNGRTHLCLITQQRKMDFCYISHFQTR